MLRFFLLVCLAHLSVGDQTINGFVILKGDLPSTGDLSTGCQLDVEVRDVSMMDAPAPLLGDSHQSSVTSFPIQYQVTYTDIGKPTSLYSLTARIMCNNKLCYRNDERISPSPTTQDAGSTSVNIPVRDICH